MTAPYFRSIDSTPVSTEEALREWAEATYNVLVGIASRYGRVISPYQLAALVQERTGVRSTEPAPSWLGRVLTIVVHRCHATDEPPLTSLVVNRSNGTVGPAYSEVQRVAGSRALNDLAREKAAAQGRLDSYRRYATDVPANAAPVMPSTFRARRDRPVRTPRAAAPKRPVVAEVPDVPTSRICPRCYLETPIEGDCQNCG